MIDIPLDVVAAATKVEQWMDAQCANSHSEWEFMGVCSRNHATRLAAARARVIELEAEKGRWRDSYDGSLFTADEYRAMLAAARERIAELERERIELLSGVKTEPFFKTPDEYDEFRRWWSEHVTKRLMDRDRIDRNIGNPIKP